MRLKIKKLHEDAIIPGYATAGAACFDLHALIEAKTWPASEPIVAPATTFRTGLVFEVPEGWAMLIYSRSGHGFKHDTRLANAVGVIDSDYRGEVLVRLRCDVGDGGGISVKHGDRIAQAMLVPVERIEFEEVFDLTDTARGAGGFGSTGSAA